MTHSYAGYGPYSVIVVAVENNIGNNNNIKSGSRGVVQEPLAG